MIGLGLRGLRLLARRDSGNFDFRLGFFLGRFSQRQLFRQRSSSILSSTAFSNLFFRFFAENFFRRRGGNFLGRNHFAFIGGLGFNGLWRFRQSGFADARALLACGTLKSRTVGSGTGIRPRRGRSGFATCSCNLLSPVFPDRARGVPERFLRGDFSSVSARADFFSEQCANPVAQPEIGQEQQADQAQRRHKQSSRRAGRACEKPKL